MAHKKPITWNGITYPSIAALAKHFNIKPNVLQVSMKRKGEEQACAYFEQYLHDNSLRRVKPIEWQGIIYPSISALCKHLGISRRSFCNMVEKKGLQKTYEYYAQTDSKQSRKQTRIPVTWKGITYRSKTELAKHFGINRNTFNYTINKKGLEAACEFYEKQICKHTPIQITWNGKTYPSYKQLAEQLNIKCSTHFYRMIKKKGLQAACEYYTTQDIKPGPISITWKDIDYTSITELSKYFNISLSSLFSYIKRHGKINACCHYEAKIRGIHNLEETYIGRDNTIRYIGQCQICGQQLILTEQEICSFQHSNSFCNSHSINLK